MQEKFITMSNREYHAHGAIGSTDLRRLMVSPLHFHGQEERTVTPPHFMFGSAAHAGYLEPDKFESEYRAKPAEVDGKGPRTNHYKDWMASQTEVNWLTGEDYDKVLKVVNSALNHPVTAEMFKGEVVTEGSLFFRLAGVNCKARPDLVNLGERVSDVLDLKTTISGADAASFTKTVANNQLHVQEWFYRKALQAANVKVGRFIFLVVEKAPPFAVAAYTLKQEDVEGVENQALKALEGYRRGMDSEVWPGYSTEVMELSLPAWATQNQGGANGNWLTVTNVMDAYDMSRSTVYNWLARGVDNRRFGGRRLVSARSLVSKMNSWRGVE